MVQASRTRPPNHQRMLLAPEIQRQNLMATLRSHPRTIQGPFRCCGRWVGMLCILEGLHQHRHISTMA